MIDRTVQFCSTIASFQYQLSQINVQFVYIPLRMLENGFMPLYFLGECPAYGEYGRYFAKLWFSKFD